MRAIIFGATMNLTARSPISTPISCLFTASFVACCFAGPALGSEKIAVFEFELQQGATVPGVPSKKEAEDKRRKMVTERLRDYLSKAGFTVIDTGPLDPKVSAANLQACGECAADFARELGADYAFTGFVYKVSELVLSMSVRVHEAATSKPVTSATVDMRGNTDESWRHGIDYLYQNVLTPRLERLH